MVQSGDRREIKRDGKNALRKGHSLNLNSLTITHHGRETSYRRDFASNKASGKLEATQSCYDM